jgi:hypothetical protein
MLYRNSASLGWLSSQASFPSYHDFEPNKVLNQEIDRIRPGISTDLLVRPIHLRSYVYTQHCSLITKPSY